jgi:hypothetical protein
MEHKLLLEEIKKLIAKNNLNKAFTILNNSEFKNNLLVILTPKIRSSS